MIFDYPQLFYRMDTSSWLGCALDQNSKDRMEDAIEVKYFPGGAIFIVLDGHNGKTSVEFVAEHLASMILNSEPFISGKFEEALSFGFQQTETDLAKFLSSGPGLVSSPRGDAELSRDFPKLTSGVVVCVVLIVGDKIYTAHAGDCRAVLCQNSKPVQLTEDHNLSNLTERIRVAEYIGPQGYVKGLMVTRSLGNLTANTNGVLVKVDGQSSLPAISKREWTDEDDFILIGSDGLFEVMGNDVVIDTVIKASKRPSFSANKSAQELVDRAISRGSSDNICVCLIMLKKFKIREV